MPRNEPNRRERELIDFFRRLRTATPHFYVTPAIIGLNGLAFIAMTVMGAHIFSPTVDQLIDFGANFGPKTLEGEWWRLFTSMFIHIGIVHIAINMWVLWNIGQFVERLVGNVGFLIVYVLSGLAGSIASVWWNPFVVSAGASGAVFGVFGVLLGYVVRQRRMIPMDLLQELQYSGGMFLVFNLIFGFTVPGIDMAAHLGGLAAGFLGGIVVSHSFDERITAGRWKRNLLVVAIGVPVLLGAAAMLPRDAPQMLNALENFDAMHEKVMTHYNQLVEHNREGEITDAEFAEALADEILPPWKSVVEQFEDPAWNGKNRDDLRKYVRLRYKAFQSLHAALKDPTDEESAERYQENWKQADQLLGENLSQDG